MSYSVVQNFTKRRAPGLGLGADPSTYDICYGHGTRTGFLDDGTKWSANCSDGTICTGLDSDPSSMRCWMSGTSQNPPAFVPPPPPPAGSTFDPTPYCAGSGGVTNSQVNDTSFVVTCANGRQCQGGAEQKTSCTCTARTTGSEPGPDYSLLSPAFKSVYKAPTSQSKICDPSILNSSDAVTRANAQRCNLTWNPNYCFVATQGKAYMGRGTAQDVAAWRCFVGTDPWPPPNAGATVTGCPVYAPYLSQLGMKPLPIFTLNKTGVTPYGFKMSLSPSGSTGSTGLPWWVIALGVLAVGGVGYMMMKQS